MMADGDPEKLPLPGAPPDKVRSAISTLYSEWEQVQTERQQWQLERAQMRAKILTLESNARTHQQVRLDLIRRIKLLEHGLMQERRNFLSRRPPSKFVTHFLHHDEFRYGGGHLYTRANEHEHKASSSSKDRAGKPRRAYYRTLPASAFSGKDLRDTTPARQFLREYLIELGYLQEVASLDSSLQTAHGSASYVPPTPTTKGRPSSIATLSRQNSSEWKAGDSPPIKDDVQVSSSGSFAKPRKTGSHLRRGSRSDIMESKSHSKTWKSMYSLRSHLDGVRAVQFLDEAPGLLTASEDGAVKLWNLSSLLDPNDHKAKKKLLEPIYTFRGHSGMVTSLQTSSKRSECYSAGVDGSVIVWQLPELSQDPYGADGSAKRFRKYILDGHSDAVWNLEVHPALGLLFSAGADGAVGVWKLAELGTEQNMGAVTSMSLKIEYTSKDQVTQVPTSCQVFPSDMNKLVVGYASGEVVVADIETGKIVRVMRSRVDNDQSNPHVTALQCHQTLTLAATAHLDTNVRLFDINQGACVDVIQTHRDAVTDVSIDPSGLYLASCSHDQSIRFWDLTSKKVIQDLDAYHTHRKKYDEAIHTVQYHPSLPLVASGGADSVIKLYE